MLFAKEENDGAADGIFRAGLRVAGSPSCRGRVVYGPGAGIVPRVGGTHFVPGGEVPADYPSHSGDMGTAEPAQRYADSPDPLGEHHRPERFRRRTFELPQHLPSARGAVPGGGRGLDPLRPWLQGRYGCERQSGGGGGPREAGGYDRAWRRAAGVFAADRGRARGAGGKSAVGSVRRPCGPLFCG